MLINLTIAATGFFWLSISILFYTYLGFSILVIIVARLRKLQVQKHSINPSVTLIVTAFNEEKSIAEKIENSLEIDYPQKKLEIIIASDGSTDGTEEITKKFENRGVKLLSLPRRGKIFAVNEAVSRSSGKIIVFSDANTLYHRNAISNLVENFADPEVGGVCGNQLYIEEKEAASSAKGENLYWSYDKWLKSQESFTGSIVSADGAIYAIRRELYKKPKDSSVTDDFAISTAVIEQGYRLIFEPEAIAYEKTTASSEHEFKRKVRIINRGLRGVFLRKKLLNPFQFGFYSLVLSTHKVLRRLITIFLLALLLSNVILSSNGFFYQITLIGQILFYLSAFIGFLFRRKRSGYFKIFYIPFYYCLVNVAALVAVFQLIGRKRIELWQPQRQLVQS